MSNPTSLTRRGLIAAGAAGMAGALATPAAAFQTAERKRSLRFAHLTDMHVQPEKRAGEGFAKCLQHVHELKDEPGLIVTGGDLIMDSAGATAERTQAQWDVFTKVVRENCKLPIRHTIGNHDVFGIYDRAKNAADPRFDEKWPCEVLELERPYYSFDQGGWHFVVLESTFALEKGYTAKLDDAQFEWLESDLAATPKSTPVVVVSHIPILMVCAIFDGKNEESGNWVIPGSYMHIDARKITDLFLKHPNVKLCLSGHEHQIDRVVYNDVTYYCSGAVSANWWEGRYFQCDYGYALVDLFNDGTFEIEYAKYDWK